MACGQNSPRGELKVVLFVDGLTFAGLVLVWSISSGLWPL